MNEETSQIVAVVNGSSYNFPAGRDEAFIRQQLLSRGVQVATMAAAWNDDGTAVNFTQALGDKGDDLV
jgi:hypothetical protein